MATTKRVRATEKGFFDRLRHEGDVFKVPEDAKASWFEDVKGAEEPAPAPDEGAAGEGESSDGEPSLV